MTRTYASPDLAARAPGAFAGDARPIRSAPPARTFEQLLARLHGNGPSPLPAGDAPPRDVSGIRAHGGAAIAGGHGRAPADFSAIAPPRDAPLQRRRAQTPFFDAGGIGGGRRARPPVGLTAALKDRMEARSSLSMDDVRVHYDSPEPDRIGALAYARGTDIHLGPGQERHLAHEAWHVVQQKQGRVRPTLRMDGLAYNDDGGLEREADALGVGAPWAASAPATAAAAQAGGLPIQRRLNVGGAGIKNPRTVRHRAALGPDDPALRILMAWIDDRTDHRFGNWDAAIAAARMAAHAARTGDGPSRRTILLFILFSLLLLGGGALLGLPLLLGGRGGPGPGGGLEPPRPSRMPEVALPPALNSTALVPVVRSLHQDLDSSALVPRPGPRGRTGRGEEPASTALVPLVRSLDRPPPRDAVSVTGEAPSTALVPFVRSLAGPPTEAAAATRTDEARHPAGLGDRETLGGGAREDERADEARTRIQALNRRHLLRHYDVIRVVTHALADQRGRGHQSAAVAVIEQLTREYRGSVRIELVIHAEREAMYVFSQLLPDLDLTADRQTLSINDQAVTVVRHDDGGQHAHNPFERALAINPADDREIWADDVTNVTAIDAIRHGAGSREVVALNPHNYGDPETARFIDTGSMTYPIESSESSIYRGNTYRDTARRSPIDPVVRNNIELIVRAAADHQIDLWPWYGLHFFNTEGLVDRARNASSNLLMGGANYQHERRGRLHRPMFIVNLSKSHAGLKEDVEAIRQMVGQAGVRVVHADIGEAFTGDLSSNAVVFLDVGALPRDWFSMLVGHATLPVVYEGANTANLAHQMGKAFFSVNPNWATPYVDVRGFERGREHLQETSALLQGPVHPRTYQAVMDVLLSLEDPESPISRYVREVLRRARTPEADQLLMALARLRDIDADRRR